MVTTRELLRSEWPILATLPCELALSYPGLPIGTIIMVAEQDGQIVGCWSLIPQWAAEGVWIEETHRGHSAVARALLRQFRQSAEHRGIVAVVTACLSDQVLSILKGLRAAALPPMAMFAVERHRKDA
jgi:hypothetical protein